MSVILLFLGNINILHVNIDGKIAAKVAFGIELYFI